MTNDPQLIPSLDAQTLALLGLSSGTYVALNAMAKPSPTAQAPRPCGTQAVATGASGDKPDAG